LGLKDATEEQEVLAIVSTAIARVVEKTFWIFAIFAILKHL
jgi:hypothetical protein